VGRAGRRPVAPWAIASLLSGAGLLVLGAALVATPRTGVALDLPREAASLTAAGEPAPGGVAPGERVVADPAVAARGSTGSLSASVPRSELVPSLPAPSAPVAPEPVAPEPATEPDDEVGARPGPVVRPSEVEVPAIGVRAPIVELGLDTRGRLEVPSDPQAAGWWTGGPEPGASGPAVLAGHVDSFRGPGVFFRLPELARGDRIVVRNDDGAVAHFAVDRVERWPKDAFPTDAVYREADGAELRLITCGGTFDRQALRYLDNIIVFAHAVER
jgi:sortase (surface protein transpeptidase)